MALVKYFLSILIEWTFILCYNSYNVNGLWLKSERIDKKEGRKSIAAKV